MIRVGISPLVLLINNSGYVIEEEIHSGPYNKISDWNYTAVVEGMAGTRKNLFTAKVPTSSLSSWLLSFSPNTLPPPPAPTLPVLGLLSPAVLLFVLLLLCCTANSYGLPLQDMQGHD